MNFPAPMEPQGGGLQDVLSRLPTVVGELKRHALVLASVFAVIALLTLGVGVLWPKKFVSATTILVGEGNIIAPLMEGRAVPTSVGDRARIASEVIFSRRLMEDVLSAGGWAASNPDALTRERIAEEIKQRTLIDSPGENLIQISYHDSQPERAFKVAQRFADLFISESLAAKERESREAYEFIAARVEEYHAKLTEAEDKLSAGNLDARPHGCRCARAYFADSRTHRNRTYRSCRNADAERPCKRRCRAKPRSPTCAAAPPKRYAPARIAESTRYAVARLPTCRLPFVCVTRSMI